MATHHPRLRALVPNLSGARGGFNHLEATSARCLGSGTTPDEPPMRLSLLLALLAASAEAFTCPPTRAATLTHQLEAQVPARSAAVVMGRGDKRTKKGMRLRHHLSSPCDVRRAEPGYSTRATRRQAQGEVLWRLSPAQCCDPYPTERPRR